MYKRSLLKSIYYLLVLVLCIQAFQIPVLGADNNQERLKDAIVLYIGNPSAIAKNELTKVDIQNSTVAPLVKDGRTLVPVRFVAENFGANIGWDGSTATVSIAKDDKIIKLVLGSNIMVVNNDEITLDVPAESIGGRTFIPLRALTDVLGKKLFWDNRGLIIISDNENIYNKDTEKNLIDDVIIKVTGRAIKIRKDDERISLSVDPRIELLSIIQLLSGYDEKFKGTMTKYDIDYKIKVNEYFKEYKNHEAVKLFAAMSSQSFNLTVPPYVMLHLTEPSELKIIKSFSETALQKSGGYTELEKFITALRNFAEKSNFDQFYYSNNLFYKNIVSETYKNAELVKNVQILEKYYGTKQENYNVILAPLLKGEFAAKINVQNNINYIYGTQDAKYGLPDFGSENLLQLLVLHDFSYPFISPLVTKYQNEINKYSGLQKSIEEKMKYFGYTSWISSANEHIYRAILSRLYYREFGKATSDRFTTAFKTDGFIYIDALCKKLEEYENNRDKYPTIDSFFPKLIEAFGEVKQ